MNDKSIRLRVVVQRNGLPEDKFMLPISLDDSGGPTVAQLLEQVNSTYFPLESDQWGLDDYAVYRQAPDDGTTFECLHFSSVRSLFRDDDQVLIRPLQTDDLRRRRIAGRYQISADGKHLLDGVPFGRPLLRVPASRPPVHIPPRKKRRLLYDQDEPVNQDEDQDRENGVLPDGQTSMLLLTNGNAHANEAPDNNNDDDDDDDEAGDEDADADEEFGGDLSDSGSDIEDEEEDLEEEVRALEEENANQEDDFEEEDATAAGSSRTRQRRARQSRTQQSPDPNTAISALRAAFPSAPLHVCEKILTASNGDLRDAYLTLCDGFAPILSEAATLQEAQIGSRGSERDPATTDNPRVEANPPANATALALARNALGDPAAEDEPMEADGDGGDGEDEVSAYVRQFDHRGLPPGTISTGKSPSHTAAAINGFFTTTSKVSGDSETTSATLLGSNGSKSSPEKISIDEDEDEDDDETSSSGTSSSSESDSSEADDSDDDDDEGDSSNEASQDDGSIDSDLGSSSGDDDSNSESGDESSQPDPGSHDVQRDDEGDSGCADEDESGPEQATTKRGPANKPQTHKPGHNTERGNAKKIGGSSEVISDATSSSEDTSSEEESSESDSSSDSESESPPKKKRHTPTSASVVGRDAPVIATSQNRATVATSAARPAPQVPPGQGKESTKSRNARRRAAQKAKKLAQAGISNVDGGPGSSSLAADQAVSTQQSLFEAKRKALLDAIASGGVEVNSKGEQVHDTQATADAQTGSKRKLNETDPHAAREQTPQETPISEAASVSTDASQKRRRIDVGAGRRLLFGALGLRNPKGDDEAEKVRAQLMKGVRPHTNQRLEQQAASDPKEAPGGGPGNDASEQPENPDAWKEVITYRAVECCQEDVELSEPPFPFVQRWDPQQQNSWSSHKDPNKRGGQGKRAQRNQAHFYQEDGGGSSGKKRKHDESFDWDGYDETFNGIEDEPPRDPDNIQLNYDDVPEPSRDAVDPVAEASQFTDMEDLPSLPRDLSSLPALRPGDVKPGMVITWKKWSCSRATNWEPRLSDVTGVVVRIDDDVTGVEVCLAKRDRDLDGTQKQYDPVTGRRVYDKFEAPDLDDDEGDGIDVAAPELDEGYRTLSFAEMQDPRVLQQPLLSDQALPSVEEEGAGAGAAKPSEEDAQHEPQGVEGAAAAAAPSQPSEASCVPESLPAAAAGLNADSGEHDARVDADAEPAVEPAAAAAAADVEETRTTPPPSHSTEHQSGQGQRDPALLSSVPSIMSQVNSPSQQLDRETMTTTTNFQVNNNNDASSFDPSIIESSGYKGDVDTEAVDNTAPLLSDSVMGGLETDRNSDDAAPVFDDDDGGDFIIAGTPKVVHNHHHQPKAAVAPVPSPAGSVRSGRQLDYTMEDEGPESLRVTEGDDEAHGGGGGGSPFLGGGVDDNDDDDDDDFSATPTKKTVAATHHQNKATTPSKASSSKQQQQQQQSLSEREEPPSSPDSVESLNTIFCTARSSRRTQSPAKPQQQQQKKAHGPATMTETAGGGGGGGGGKHHLGYEEAMRKLDEQSDEEQEEGSEDEFPEIPDSFPQIKKSHDDADERAVNLLNAGADDDDDDDDDEEFPLPKTRRQRRATIQTKISPPPPKRPRRRSKEAAAPSSQIVIPPGTQVIDLLSSSDAEPDPDPEPEPQFTEDYADEDVDETYAPTTSKSKAKAKSFLSSSSSSLPRGPGWIEKSVRTGARMSAGGGRRGFSASQGQSQSQSQSQSQGSMSFSAAAAAAPSSSLPELGTAGRKSMSIRTGARRKISARF